MRLVMLFALLVTGCLVGTVGAQARDEKYPVSLVVRTGSHDAAGCFEVGALQERIAHYRGVQAARLVELQLELVVDGADSAELTVHREEVPVSRRRFEQLPSSCVDRRNAIGLSIALALESALHDVARAAAPSPRPSGAVDSPSASGAVASPRMDEDGTTAVAAASESSLEEVQAAEMQGQLAARELPRDPATTAAAVEPAPVGRARQSQSSDDDASETAVHGEAGRGPVIHLHLGGRGLAEALPAAVWMGVVGVELWVRPQLGFDLSAFASALGSSEVAGARAETRLIGGELFGCLAPRFGPVAAEGCLGLTAAACAVRGRDFPVGEPSATLLWAAGATRFGARWPAEGSISLRLVLQVHVNLVRPELRVDGWNERLYPSWVGGSGGLDVIVALE